MTTDELADNLYRTRDERDAALFAVKDRDRQLKHLRAALQRIVDSRVRDYECDFAVAYGRSQDIAQEALDATAPPAR